MLYFIPANYETNLYTWKKKRCCFSCCFWLCVALNVASCVCPPHIFTDITTDTEKVNTCIEHEPLNLQKDGTPGECSIFSWETNALRSMHASRPFHIFPVRAVGFLVVWCDDDLVIYYREKYVLTSVNSLMKQTLSCFYFFLLVSEQKKITWMIIIIIISIPVSYTFFCLEKAAWFFGYWAVG